jgi:hypothetical protein
MAANNLVEKCDGQTTAILQSAAAQKGRSHEGQDQRQDRYHRDPKRLKFRRVAQSTVAVVRNCIHQTQASKKGESHEGQDEH